MANSTLTAEPQIALRILDDFILDPDILLKRCPLDYGRHKLEPRFDLGDLEKLPTELHHHMLNFLDAKSLLVFRRVNQSAMSMVNGMVEHHRVMDNASNCIRMAIALKTEDTFTIKQLFDKLFQKTCDGANCEKLAPYLDVFTLNRRCLFIGGGCPIPLGPLRQDCVGDVTWDGEKYDSDRADSIRHFDSIEGSIYTEFWLPVDEPNGPHDAFWIFTDGQTVFKNPDNSDSVAEFSVYENIAAHSDPYWKLCAVQAP